jgi:2,4-dienoyl-CoA reductase-like NADH-dependent reductase (Old Yellow Enzyme family)
MIEKQHLSPITFPVSGRQMKNRIALAPMTNVQSHPDGRMSKEEHLWLQKRIDGGFGMIITAAAYVQENGKAWHGQIGIHNDATAESFKALNAEASRQDCLSIIQLFHGGLRSLQGGPSPSGNADKQNSMGTPMLKNEIHESIRHFIESAKRAKAAGFSGVEIHGAHGYLVHQFLSTATNTRSDEWGGNLQNRARFLLEIVRGVRENCGEDFVLGVRLSPEDNNWFHGIEFEACLDLSAQLAEEEGVDYLHISLWDAFKSPDAQPESAPAISQVRKWVNQTTPIMTAGKIWTVEDAHKCLDLGADILALGRVAIAHPNWAKDSENADFQPNYPPFSTEYLKNAGLSQPFIEYMKKWKGFVNS